MSAIKQINLTQLCDWVIKKEKGQSFYTIKLVAHGVEVKPSASCSILWVLKNTSMQTLIFWDGIHNDWFSQGQTKT